MTKFKLPRRIRVRNKWITDEYFVEGKTYWMTHFDSEGFCDIKGKEQFPNRCEWRLKRFEPLPLTNQDKKGIYDVED